ncbi:hypothetical protein UK12_28010 [Saccharothrix sp. ST-888]|nr:hypothetical protein UK12_28010 [Saccharothrix sp. ST-888]
MPARCWRPRLSCPSRLHSLQGSEVLVSAQWSRVLGFPTSIDDNFFECGGNSFKAARLAGGLRNAIGREDPTTIPVALFSLPGRFDGDIADARGVSDRAELGLADLRQTDAAEPGMPVVAHEPTLDAIEAWLRDVEGTA